MTNEPYFLLGVAFSLLTQCRSYFILTNDTNAMKMLEEEYQRLYHSLETFYHKPHVAEKSHGKQDREGNGF